ncbi:MAG: NUDIX hydrolase [Thermoanaerobaculia bacterium]
MRERLLLSDQKEIDWYYIDSPESVIVVPFVSPDRLLLIRQFRRNLGKDTLELPAGTIHQGESADSAALRELREETGYAAKTAAFELLGRFYVLPSETNRYVSIYRAYPIEHVGPPTRDQEIEKYFDMSLVEMGFDDAIAALGDAIQGIETSAALLLAARRRP